MPQFRQVKPEVKFPELEQKIIKFWKKQDVFKKSQEKREALNKGWWPWLEGPPTANAEPHPGHVLTRAVKDLFCRYRHMQGFFVPRRGGWDTHGLPVELEVEKELGLKTKKDIENYGIAKFNEKCKQSVFRYIDEWDRMCVRIGHWFDQYNSYITLKNEYIESVWWTLKEIWKKGLLVKSFYVVPVCVRCDTPLSSHELAMGSQMVKEPSIYVKFKKHDSKDTYFLAWTTTPWTLYGNAALTVHPDEVYAVVQYKNEKLILAEALVEHVLGSEHEVLKRIDGTDLEGQRYEPLFDVGPLEKPAHYVILADYVTTTEGTGVVHTAPAFGPEDFDSGQEYGLPLINPLDSLGRFTEAAPQFQGEFAKDTDERTLQNLEERGLLFRVEAYEHEYPFCWRCDTVVLYMPRDAWFIKMTVLRDNLLANNEQINWVPPHLKHGRFGNFLENVRDWALSRDRYWGTPLPVWTCGADPDHKVCVGGLNELKELVINWPGEIDLHRPTIDDIKLKCLECGSEMTREPYVIDAWYDSGSAGIAQWHYPFENQERFQKEYPPEFITEAIDQTRGWFYSQVAIGTAVFNKPAFMNCLTVGHVQDKIGEKMSKSKGNYISPWLVFDSSGADAFRWYFFNNTLWRSLRFSPEPVDKVMNRFIGTLWNTYTFFVTYAKLDGFDPNTAELPYESRPLLDRWLLSRLQRTIKVTKEELDRFFTHRATKALESFVMDDLSNWWVRRSRRRFWKSETDTNKTSAYVTLFEILHTLTSALAPFIPFITEEIYQNIFRRNDEPLSVHDTAYPEVLSELIDEDIELAMSLAQRVVETSRAMRTKAGIRGRQPLTELIICTPDGRSTHLMQFRDLIADELNVKTVRIVSLDEADSYKQTVVKPSWKALGPKFGANAKVVAEGILKTDPVELVEQLRTEGQASIIVRDKTHVIDSDDVEIELEPKEDYVHEDSGQEKLFLNVNLSPELIEEGFVRDVVRRVQSMRKDMDLEYSQNIEVYYEGDEFAAKAIEAYRDYITQETLAIKLLQGRTDKGKTQSWKIDDRKISLGVFPLS